MPDLTATQRRKLRNPCRRHPGTTSAELAPTQPRWLRWHITGEHPVEWRYLYGTPDDVIWARESLPMEARMGGTTLEAIDRPPLEWLREEHHRALDAEHKARVWADRIRVAIAEAQRG